MNKSRRCDRCGALAIQEAQLPSGSTLDFCQHHFNDHQAKLIDIGAKITELVIEAELVALP